jgi:hypothetical protein
MSVACVCPLCNNSQIPAPSRQQITNQNVARATGCGLGISVVVTFLIGGPISSILPLLLGALLAFAMIVLPAWLLTNWGTDLLYSNSHGYKDYRRDGGCQTLSLTTVTSFRPESGSINALRVMHESRAVTLAGTATQI